MSAEVWMAGGAQRPGTTVWSYGFALSGALFAGVLILLESLGVRLGGESVLVVAAYAAAAAAAMIVGVAVNKPASRTPWLLLTAANVVVSLVFALWLFDMPMGPLGRRVTGLTPMVLTVLAVIPWVRSEARGNTRRVALDAAIVGLGAVSASWAAFVTPHLMRDHNVWDAPLGRTALVPLIAASFMVMIHLCIARGRANRAYLFAAVGILALGVAVVLFLADRAYPGTIWPRHAMYALLPVIVGLYAAAALHPTMADPIPADRPVQDHPLGRFLVIAPVLGGSAVIAALSPPATDIDRLFRLFVYCAMLVAVLIRSEYAIGASEKKQAQAQVQALHDDLTGLPNRAALYADLADSDGHVRAACCVLFMDLNDFKLVNDSFGHRVGDELLRMVSDRIVNAVRLHNVDADVYRYGGDEFVIVSRACDSAGTEAGASKLADAIVAALRQPFELSVGRVFVSTSIGIAVPPPDQAPDADDLIREADSAMYHVKASHPGGYALFDDGLRSIAVSELALSSSLREAVDRDEFELFYLPIVELASGEVVAYEALLRWHLNGETVAPAEFIRIAESSDLIVGIGEWVIDRACRQVAQWRREHESLYVSVNVSARQLRSGGLVAAVANALRRYDLPGDAVLVELTESALIDDAAAALAALDELVAMKVKIAIDDFGTGDSALGHLLRFPIDVVKIDKSFIQAADGDRRMFVLASAIEVLAEALELSSVAEGVETTQQEALVRAIGCTYAQGWLYGKPMPAELVVPGRSA